MSPLASEDEEGDEYWRLVRELQRRRERHAFEQLVLLVVGESEKARRVALNVLAQLGTPERPFLEESLPLVIGQCGPEQPAGVLDAAVSALGHLGDPRGLTPALRLVAHSDEDARFAVAVSLGVDQPYCPTAATSTRCTPFATRVGMRTIPVEIGSAKRSRRAKPLSSLQPLHRLVDCDALTPMPRLYG
jgi:hypothetical protein